MYYASAEIHLADGYIVGCDAGEEEYIYDLLTEHGIDHHDALDAACWCGLADFGSTYSFNGSPIWIELVEDED